MADNIDEPPQKRVKLRGDPYQQGTSDQSGKFFNLIKKLFFCLKIQKIQL